MPTLARLRRHALPIFVTACLTAGAAAQRSPQWLFVPTNNGNYAGVSMQKMASIYLKRTTWAHREPDKSFVEADTSRFVIGTPTDNVAAKKLCEQLGIQVDDQKLRYSDRDIPSGQCLMLHTDDPDGKGKVVLFTAVDAASIYCGFTVPFDMARAGFTIARRNQVVHKGTARSGKLQAFDMDRVIVVRLDRMFDQLVASQPGESAADVALHVARGLAGYDFVLKSAVGNAADGRTIYGNLLGKDQAALADIRKRYQNVDLTATVRRIYRQCHGALAAGQKTTAPIIYVLYGMPGGGSNAMNFGKDEVSGRTRVLLNLSMLKSKQDFEVAAAHELTHTFQSFRPRLVDRTIMEGTATLISQLLVEGTSDAAALMWSEPQLQAAHERRAGMIAQVRKHAQAVDQRTLGAFLRADRTLPNVPGAPGRSAYYVGWLAAKAWRKQHPKASLADLLAAKPDDVLAALGR